MGDDIVTSLRASAQWIQEMEHESWFGTAELQREAADEIERLRAEVERLRAERDASRLIINDLTAEVERLRAALALAVGELSTYGPMRYTSPEQLMEHFIEEARRD